MVSLPKKKKTDFQAVEAGRGAVAGAGVKGFDPCSSSSSSLISLDSLSLPLLPSLKNPYPIFNFLPFHTHFTPNSSQIL